MDFGVLFRLSYWSPWFVLLQDDTFITSLLCKTKQNKKEREREKRGRRSDTSAVVNTLGVL